MSTKKCTKCGELKPLNKYHKRKSATNGARDCYCKDCGIAMNLEYSRTKKGLLTVIYNRQKKRRGSDYTRLELIEWAMSQDAYHKLYDDWLTSGYSKDLVPSVDRIDDYKGYSFDNIQLMTWKDNNEKGRSDRVNGLNNKDSTAVVQMTLGGGFIASHYSMHQADRVTGISFKYISLCCLGKLNTAGGFRWMKSV